MPVYDPSTHDDLIDVNITLAALSSGRASFSTILLVVDAVTPGGGTIATYNNLAEVVADIANLNTIAQSMATAIFAQARAPDQIIIVGIDVSGGDVYADGVDAAIAAGANFYGVVADTRTPAQQVALATDIETKAASGIYLLYITQDDDADWLTSGIPSAWSAAAGYERTVVCYHDDNDNDAGSDRLDCALASRALAWDADETSAPWTCAVSGVDALGTALTSTQKGFARANYANTALPMGTTTDTWVDPGQTLAGRPADHIVSADWLRTRITEDVADLLVAVANRGTKLAVDTQGQSQVATVIEGRFIGGIDAGHLLDYRLTPLAVTSTDIANQRVRFDGEAQFSTGIRQVQINLYMSADALAA